jgi:putative redox protein
MTSELIYEGGYRTTATHLRSGTKINTDAPVDNKGKGEFFSPTDLVATGLGACIVTTMAMSAETQGVSMEGARVTVNKIMGSDPRRIARIEIDIYMPDLPYTEKERKILDRASHLCPVARSLSAELEEVVNIHWAS